VLAGNVIGTYIHGPLLPKNPELADWLIGRALERRMGPVELEPLDDQLAHEAHRVAMALPPAG
jgi:CobQ-like glutamine amidotransferase family enzyme